MELLIVFLEKLYTVMLNGALFASAAAIIYVILAFVGKNHAE